MKYIFNIFRMSWILNFVKKIRIRNIILHCLILFYYRNNKETVDLTEIEKFIKKFSWIEIFIYDELKFKKRWIENSMYDQLKK